MEEYRVDAGIRDYLHFTFTFSKWLLLGAPTYVERKPANFMLHISFSHFTEKNFQLGNNWRLPVLQPLKSCLSVIVIDV